MHSGTTVVSQEIQIMFCKYLFESLFLYSKMKEWFRICYGWTSAVCCAPWSPILTHPVCHFFPNSGSARLLLLVVLFLWCWGCCCYYSMLFPTLSSGVRITLSWPSTSFPPALFQRWSLSMPVLLSDYRKCHNCLKCTYLGDKTYNLSITFP